MKKESILLFLLGLFAMTACSDDEAESAIYLETTANRAITIAYADNSQSQIKFTSPREWTASSSAAWLTVSPAEGKGSSRSITLTITANSENTSNRTRVATVTLASGSATQTISVTQETSSSAIEVEKDSYNIATEGGIVEINFTTSLSKGQLVVYGTEPWLSTSDTKSRATTAYTLRLEAGANTSKSTRTASILFCQNRGNNQEPLTLKTVTITQLGNAETSTDFSKDGEVRTLQTATKGSGIPIILTGDGFIDKEIADGTFDNVINKAYENFFSEEPIKSLKEYFNVYAVTAVSQNNGFGGSYKTTYGCTLEGGNSTLIEGNEEACQAYAKKAVSDLDEALILVLLNTPEYAGTTEFGFVDSKKQETNLAIAFCAIIDNLDSKAFRTVISHEAVGHGFAKLEDEYGYEEYGAIPQSTVSRIKKLQAKGWYANVDFTDNQNAVLWSKFISDGQYSWEKIGAYTGACTYWSGAYRPTEESIMRSAASGFNAPSREAIYKRVMSFTANWTYNYNDFTAFDLANTDKTAITASRATLLEKPFAHPRFVNKTIITGK